MQNADLVERSTRESRDVDTGSMPAWQEVSGNVLQCIVVRIRGRSFHIPRIFAVDIATSVLGITVSVVAVCSVEVVRKRIERIVRCDFSG